MYWKGGTVHSIHILYSDSHAALVVAASALVIASAVTTVPKSFIHCAVEHRAGNVGARWSNLSGTAVPRALRSVWRHDGDSKR